ncbi:hypothetical protein Bbelb_143590 [Branchiostoma belcheri]|nr:hypothetical protein Bbelb_143590 [Branchiostoma belcheri]
MCVVATCQANRNAAATPHDPTQASYATDLSPAGFPVSADLLFYAKSSFAADPVRTLCVGRFQTVVSEETYKTLRSAVIEAWLAAPNALGAEGITLSSRRSG